MPNRHRQSCREGVDGQVVVETGGSTSKKPTFCWKAARRRVDRGGMPNPRSPRPQGAQCIPPASANESVNAGKLEERALDRRPMRWASRRRSSRSRMLGANLPLVNRLVCRHRLCVYTSMRPCHRARRGGSGGGGWRGVGGRPLLRPPLAFGRQGAPTKAKCWRRVHMHVRGALLP